MDGTSIIVLDSSDEESNEPKRAKIVTRPPEKSLVTASKGTAPLQPLNGESTEAAGGNRQPQRPSAPNQPVKRIKPLTVATNISNWNQKDVDNNNAGIGRARDIASVNENFAMIGYAEDWEKDLQRYQEIIKQHDENKRKNREEQQQQPRQEEQTEKKKRKSPVSSLADDELTASERKTATPASTSSSSNATSTTAATTESRPSTLRSKADGVEQQKAGNKKKKIQRSSDDVEEVPRLPTGGSMAFNNAEKNPIGKEFAELLDACRKADPSTEMEALIKKKLIRYYECVHPDYINSKSFKKTVVAVRDEILQHPDLVYLKLANIVEELNIRRKSRNSVMTNENVTSTGNEKKDNQIRRLNRALYILKKRIAKLEEMEVDFDEDINSAYMMEERYKKRAFEIYEKICDITGESKHAHRMVRKPIHFNGTHYAEFNRTIQKFVNRTNTFPDYFDVLKCLQHCNTQYGYGMRRDDVTKVAQDAFIKIGKLLQKRRKTDLYETVSYYSGMEKDPAQVDKKLQEKLEDNKRHYRKIGDIIDKFARVQDNDTDDEEEEPQVKPSGSSSSNKAAKAASTATTSVSENVNSPASCTNASCEPAASKSTTKSPLLLPSTAPSNSAKDKSSTIDCPRAKSSSSSGGSSSGSSNSNSSSSSSSSSSNSNSSSSTDSSSGVNPPTEDAKMKARNHKVDENPSSSTMTGPTENGAVNLAGEVQLNRNDEEEDDDDDDEDEDDDDDDDEMVIKENVKPDTFDDIVISDDEELIVPNS